MNFYIDKFCYELICNLYENGIPLLSVLRERKGNAREKILTVTFKESSSLQYLCESHISRTAGWRASWKQRQLKVQSIARNKLCKSVLQLGMSGGCVVPVEAISALPGSSCTHRLCSVIFWVTLPFRCCLPFVVSDGFRTRQHGFWQGWRLQLVRCIRYHVFLCMCLHA